MNGTDPTGAGWFAFAAVLALIAAGAVAIDVGVRTGDVGAALKAGAVTFLSSMAIAVGVDAGLGIVATHVSPATMETVTNVLAVAGLASGGYGVAEAARNGMYATAVVGALLLAAGAYRLLGGGRSTGAGQAPAGADQPPRDLNQREKEILESVVGPDVDWSKVKLNEREKEILRTAVGDDVDWSKVKLDEGFTGERYARGQVRSDFEINVESGYSGWTDEGRKFGLLTHEGVHIWQRQQGRLNNFGGAMRHLWSWLSNFGDPHGNLPRGPRIPR
ncbi:MAG: hypothetical protein KatS3mg077_2023 [Candidatus Binatia bacterium]|nr:MAG: hypothetical protein KatS3mg077_2023 [Candidatus Binatia bacterium]